MSDENEFYEREIEALENEIGDLQWYNDLLDDELGVVQGDLESALDLIAEVVGADKALEGDDWFAWSHEALSLLKQYGRFGGRL